MITRRRGRMTSPSEEQQVEVSDLPSPTETLPADDLDAAAMDLDDLLDMDEFRWTLERESASPLFDMELAEFGVYCKNEEDNVEGSSASSPERSSSDSKTRNRPSSRVINKNAIAARLNRLKKKEYVTDLEKRVGGLSSENSSLKQENSQLTKRVEELEDETRYLRAVLANESVLAQLLSRLTGVNGMKLSSSLFQGPDSNDHDYALPRSRVEVEDKETAGGVCLHVDKDHVSVEFCTKCAQRASSALKM